MVQLDRLWPQLMRASRQLPSPGLDRVLLSLLWTLRAQMAYVANTMLYYLQVRNSSGSGGHSSTTSRRGRSTWCSFVSTIINIPSPNSNKCFVVTTGGCPGCPLHVVKCESWNSILDTHRQTGIRDSPPLPLWSTSMTSPRLQSLILSPSLSLCAG